MWTIVQTGLLYNWILNSTLQHVVYVNPTIQFEYVGMFQYNAIGKRWMGYTPQHSRILLDERRDALSRMANLHVRMLGVRMVNREPIPTDFRGRKTNFQNDLHQLENLRLATSYISKESAYVLRIREDVGWYSPFNILEAPRITLKNCKRWGGVNDKIWYGSRKEVVALHMAYYDTFMHQRTFNTESALKLALRNTSIAELDITASDARVRANGTLCWKGMYACESTPKHLLCPKSMI